MHPRQVSGTAHSRHCNGWGLSRASSAITIDPDFDPSSATRSGFPQVLQGIRCVRRLDEAHEVTFNPSASGQSMRTIDSHYLLLLQVSSRCKKASYDRHFGSETFDTLLEMGDVKVIILHGFDQRRFRCKFPGIGSNVLVVPLADLRGIVHRGHLWSIRCAPREAVGLRQTRLNASGSDRVDMTSRGLECMLLSIVNIRQQDTSAPMATYPPNSGFSRDYAS